MAGFSDKARNDGTEPLTDRVRSFYIDKTIQRDFDFLIYFPEQFGNIRSFHAVSVEVPDFSFKKMEYFAGPFVYTQPVFEHNGFEFTIKFEEDSNGTVKNLINRLIRNNINSDGYHKTNLIPRITVSMFRQDAKNSMIVNFVNCYYMKSSGATYSYESNGKIQYDITFNADYYEVSDKASAGIALI